MKKERDLLLALVLILVMSCANAEVLLFCDSVPMHVTPWSYNATFPKFNSSLGELKSIEISAVYNVTQNYRAENEGESNATFNSSLQSFLQIEIPDGRKLTCNISRMLSKNLAPFDGISDYLGSSGINLNESSSSGVVVWDYLPTSDFLANAPNEEVLLNLSSKDLNSFHLSGDLDSKIKTMADARVCVSYNYDREQSQQ